MCIVTSEKSEEGIKQPWNWSSRQLLSTMWLLSNPGLLKELKPLSQTQKDFWFSSMLCRKIPAWPCNLGRRPHTAEGVNFNWGFEYPLVGSGHIHHTLTSDLWLVLRCHYLLCSVNEKIVNCSFTCTHSKRQPCPWQLRSSSDHFNPGKFDQCLCWSRKTASTLCVSYPMHPKSMQSALLSRDTLFPPADKRRSMMMDAQSIISSSQISLYMMTMKNAPERSTLPQALSQEQMILTGVLVNDYILGYHKEHAESKNLKPHGGIYTLNLDLRTEYAVISKFQAREALDPLLSLMT